MASESRRSFAYIRVSTARQATEGISLEDQESSIRSYCHTKGFDEPLLFADVASAKRVEFAKREAGGRLVDLVQPGDHIVMAKIDRGFRNLHDFLHWFDVWIPKGIYIHVLNFGGNTIDPTTALGRMVFRILAVIAEMEREIHSERITEAHAHFRERGLSMTGQTFPMGWKREAVPGGGFRAVPDGPVRDWCERCLALSQSTAHRKGMTQSQIAEHLTKQGAIYPGAKAKFKNKPRKITQAEVGKWIKLARELNRTTPYSHSDEYQRVLAEAKAEDPEFFRQLEEEHHQLMWERQVQGRGTEPIKKPLDQRRFDKYRIEEIKE